MNASKKSEKVIHGSFTIGITEVNARIVKTLSYDSGKCRAHQNVQRNACFNRSSNKVQFSCRLTQAYLLSTADYISYLIVLW